MAPTAAPSWSNNKMPTQEAPKLFTLLKTMTIEERQRFGEERRKMKDAPGVTEELVRDGDQWKLEYRKAGKAVGELRI